MGGGGLSVMVTWEDFLEALGEPFWMDFVPLSEQSEFGTFIQISEPSASKNLNRNPGR